MAKKKNQAKAKKGGGNAANGKPNKLNISIPPTPSSESAPTSAGIAKEKKEASQGPQSGIATPVLFATPPTSPSSPAVALPPMDVLLLPDPQEIPITQTKTPESAIGPTAAGDTPGRKAEPESETLPEGPIANATQTPTPNTELSPEDPQVGALELIHAQERASEASEEAKSETSAEEPDRAVAPASLQAQESDAIAESAADKSADTEVQTTEPETEPTEAGDSPSKLPSPESEPAPNAAEDTEIRADDQKQALDEETPEDPGAAWDLSDLSDHESAATDTPKHAETGQADSELDSTTVLDLQAAPPALENEDAEAADSPKDTGTTEPEPVSRKNPDLQEPTPPPEFEAAANASGQTTDAEAEPEAEADVVRTPHEKLAPTEDELVSAVAQADDAAEPSEAKDDLLATPKSSSAEEAESLPEAPGDLQKTPTEPAAEALVDDAADTQSLISELEEEAAVESGAISTLPDSQAELPPDAAEKAETAEDQTAWSNISSSDSVPEAEEAESTMNMGPEAAPADTQSSTTESDPEDGLAAGSNVSLEPQYSIQQELTEEGPEDAASETAFSPAGEPKRVEEIVDEVETAIPQPEITEKTQETPPTRSPVSPVLRAPSPIVIPPSPEPSPGVNLSAANLPISAHDIASGPKDIIAMAELFATMKKAALNMQSAFDRLGSQSEKMISYSLDIQAAEHLKQIRVTLNTQIERQNAELAALRSTLKSRVKAAVEERIQNHLRELVRESLQETIKQKVQEELAKQIPEDLRQQVISHQRQILEVKTTLHNSEARRYNGLLQTTSNARLRPLLRPLPTPEQSPVAPPITRSSSNGTSTLPTPATAYPRVPAPTPIKRSTSNPFRIERGPPTASALFPEDLRSLFKLGPDDTRKLLRDYGLVSASSTPAVERPPRDRGLPSVDEELNSGSDSESGSGDEGSEVHAADMNKFMAHIGVPFLMVPAPREKVDTSAPMSSRTRRRTMLTPLIIK